MKQLQQLVYNLCVSRKNHTVVRECIQVKLASHLWLQVKLACASIITTPYYLLLDTDVFFVKHSSARDLLMESSCTNWSPVCDRHRKLAYQAKNDCYPLVNRTEEQLVWMQATAKTLQLEVSRH